MKKTLFLIVLTFSILIFAQSSNIIVNYNFLESYRGNLHLNSTLKNNGNNSLYEIDDKMIEEKTETTSDKDGNPVITSYKKPKENRIVVKNFKDNSLIILDSSYNSSNFFNIEEKIPSFDWKIGNETEEILGYQCKKATMTFRGRNYIAWFAPKIPISDGPWKFGGLPGLILKVEDDNSKIKIEANKIVLNAENIDTSFKINEKYPKVSWEEYIKNVDKDFNNQIKALKSKASEMGGEIELDFKFENMEYVSKKDENN